MYINVHETRGELLLYVNFKGLVARGVILLYFKFPSDSIIDCKVIEVRWCIGKITSIHQKTAVKTNKQTKNNHLKNKLTISLHYLTLLKIPLPLRSNRISPRISLPQLFLPRRYVTLRLSLFRCVLGKYH